MGLARYFKTTRERFSSMLTLITGTSLALLLAFLILWTGDKIAYENHLRAMREKELKRRYEASTEYAPGIMVASNAFVASWERFTKENGDF